MPIKLGEDAKGGPAAGMPLGEHDVTITKVMTSAKDGMPYMTKDGDKKILVLFENSEGHEAMDGMQVEGKGVWKIARLLSTVGYHDEELSQEGIREYTDFLDRKTAERLLVKRTLRIRISERLYQGQMRTNVDVLGPDLGGTKPVTTREISDADRVGIEVSREDIPF